MKIALVVSDDLSVMLFCKGIIATLRSIPHSHDFVVCEITKYHKEIEALACTPIGIGANRFFHPVKDFRYLLRLRQFFRSNSISIVFNFATKQNIYGTIAARLAGVPSVFSHVVGRGTAFEDRHDVSGYLLQQTTSYLYRLVGRWSQKIWFTNSSDRKFFVESNLMRESKTVLTRNYLDVREYSLSRIDPIRREMARKKCKITGNERIVVMVARMIWAKGIREFVEAAASLRDSHPHLKFVLIAPLETGSFGAVPAEFVHDFEAKANFAWLGFQEDVKAFYAIADLAVLPSYYKEGGYPRALLEPMAMGKPIITTDTDGCRGTVENGLNGILIPPRDSAALAQGIIKIMDDDTLRDKMGKYSELIAFRDFDEQNIVPTALRTLGLPIPKNNPSLT